MVELVESPFEDLGKLDHRTLDQRTLDHRTLDHRTLDQRTLDQRTLDHRTLDRLDSPWVTIVWNDPVNLMTYVSFVFHTYFGYSAAEAERLMLRVHTQGRAVVASGGREEMERHVEAMHDFGLWATLARSET